MSKIYRIAIFGASPDTKNMGVSALLYSLLSGVLEKLPDVEFVIFDNQLGKRIGQLNVGSKEVTVTFYGARVGKRIYRQENLATMLFLSKLGRLGSTFNQGLRLIDACDAVIDVSAGDSFSDIYGFKRFNSILWPKIIAKNRGKQLIFAPQTYGPYRDERIKEKAAEASVAADMCWARDLHSFEILKNLLGHHFSPEKHYCGVDMAFKLPVQDASLKVSKEILDVINTKSEDKPLIGINVSGLIYQDKVSAKTNYHFIADYNMAVLNIVEHLLMSSSANILFISHVMDQLGHYESDYAAAVDVKNKLPNHLQSRVFITPATLNQSEVKWIISQLDWFCGTRMHSTIASLSMSVPTASISYSDKTKGVFETCGQGEQVADPRVLDNSQILSLITNSFNDRKLIKASLSKSIISVLEQADNQMNQMVNFIEH